MMVWCLLGPEPLCLDLRLFSIPSLTVSADDDSALSHAGLTRAGRARMLLASLLDVAAHCTHRTSSIHHRLES